MRWSHPWWALGAIGVAASLVACGASPQLAAWSSDSSGGEICSPIAANGRVHFAGDSVTNHSDEPITVTAIELDSRSRGVRVVRAGFYPAPVDKTLGYIGADEGQYDFDSESTLEVAPGASANLDVVLELTTPEAVGIAYGFTVTGQTAGGKQVDAHTCWSVAVAPTAIGCDLPDEDGQGGASNEVDAEYMSSVCTLPKAEQD